MPRRSRHTGSWLAIGWVAGTVTAVLISIVAIHLAGSKVTSRPIDVVSKQGVEDALVGDATVLVRDPDTDDTADSVASDDLGGSASGSDDSSGSGSRSGSDESSSGSGSGDDGESSSGSGSGGGGSGDSGGSSGGSSGSTTTTVHEDSDSPTTTAAPSSPVSKTVSGNTVTIRCTGDTIALVSSTAASGFAKEIDKNGPQEVSVQFANHQTDAEVEIQARCSNGSVTWSN